MTSISRSNVYTADSTLVTQTQSSTTTRSTQDLAAPLSQILSDGTNRYVYGNPAERLFAQQGSSARTWYAVDALGSVRAILNDAGLPQAVANYDAWGVPETPLLGSFGFTGELQRGNDVWLRARWYGAGRGAFGARDAYQGEATRPYSMMPYQYAYANPVLWMDASGRDPGTPPSFMFCNQSPCPGWDPPPPCDSFDITQVDPQTNMCPSPPSLPSSPSSVPHKPWGFPWDIGVVLEFSGACGLGIGANAGLAMVFDFYDFEFNVFGSANGPIALGASINVSGGYVWGWSTYQKKTVDNYKGLFGTLGVASGPISIQGGASQKGPDGGQLWSASFGAGLALPGRINGSALGQALQRLNVAGISEIGYAGTAEDLHLPSSKRVFHQPDQRPTLQDAEHFKRFITAIFGPLVLSPLGPSMEALIWGMHSVVDFNATEWQKQTDYMWSRRTYQ